MNDCEEGYDIALSDDNVASTEERVQDTAFESIGSGGQERKATDSHDGR